MSDHHQLYELPHPVYASSICNRIYGLSRIGVAATDSAMNLDLNKSGYFELFEVIAQLAFDLGDMIEELERVKALPEAVTA